MELHLTSTDQITHIDGVAVRVWEGVTAAGTRCKVFVHRIGVADTEDLSHFERELQECLPPGRAVDLRHIL